MQHKYLVGSRANQREGILTSPDDRERHQPMAETLDWALGRRSTGELRTSPAVHHEAAKCEPDLHEIARLLRGGKPSTDR